MTTASFRSRCKKGGRETDDRSISSTSESNAETDLKFGTEFNPTKSNIDFNQKFSSISGQIIINSRANFEKMQLDGDESGHQQKPPRLEESELRGGLSVSQSEWRLTEVVKKEISQSKLSGHPRMTSPLDNWSRASRKTSKEFESRQKRSKKQSEDRAKRAREKLNDKDEPENVFDQKVGRV